MKPSHSFSARPALPPRSGGPPNQDLRWNFFVVLAGRCWKFLKLVKISNKKLGSYDSRYISYVYTSWGI